VLDGDHLRIHRVCRELARDFDLTLVASCETHDEVRRSLRADGAFVRIERIHLPKSRSWMNCVLGATAEVFHVSVPASHVDRADLFPMSTRTPGHVLVCGTGVDAADMPFRTSPS
jgi:hypothetical protein